MLKEHEMRALKQIAQGIAEQFGSNCEVVIHEIGEQSAYQSVAAIYNGHVTGRKLGDGPSHVVLEQLGRQDQDPEDRTSYLTRTPDGKVLKSSSIYIRDEAGRVAAILGINFDVSALTMVEHAVGQLISPKDTAQKEPQRITLSVTDLLDELIRQSETLVGKPAALMNKDDKVKALRFLSQNGALLITKSGDKLAKHFGISKYTLYSYLDMKTGGENA